MFVISRIPPISSNFFGKPMFRDLYKCIRFFYLQIPYPRTWPLGCSFLYVLLFQDVEVKIRSSHVLVKVKGQTLVNDELLNRCDPEMSRWEIRGTRLVLVLQKEAGSTIPWPNVFVKDCKTHFDLSDVL